MSCQRQIPDIMNSEPDPAGFIPTIDEKKVGQVPDEKHIASDEVAPDVSDGEMVAIDKEGNVDIIRESDYTSEEYKKLLRKLSVITYHTTMTRHLRG